MTPNNIKESTQQLIFYTLWVSFAIVQSASNDLMHDEAYYWKFSQHLDWGFFDHPPMIAVMIWISEKVTGFHNELIVRFLPILLNLGTLLILEKLIRPKSISLFFIVAGSSVFLQFGFFAFPDSPMLFFIALLFYRFKRYLEKDNIINSVILAIVVAALLYSKYHGFLVVLLLIVANLDLLKRRSFYLIIGLGVILYFPHIIWQVNHDFVSLKYHFIDRSLNAYSISYTAEFVAELLFVIGGFATVFMIYATFSVKILNEWDKTLKWSWYGMIVFFFIMSFKGPVEANWISIGIVPVFILTFNYLDSSTEQFKIWLKRTAALTTILLVIIRGILLVDLSVYKIDLLPELQHQQQWANDITKSTNGLPLVFMNSYKKAAKYEFYSGIKAVSLNNVMGRRNQYSLEYEEDLYGKKVALILNYSDHSKDSMLAYKYWEYFEIVSNFRAYSKLKLVPLNWSRKLKKNTVKQIELCMINKYDYKIKLSENPENSSVLSYQFFKNNKFQYEIKTSKKISNRDFGKPLAIDFLVPKETGDYMVNISISTGNLPATINSENLPLKVE